MPRTPNFEQLKAIEHKGGVLLKAGAGSGKTFVLIEHIIYLTRQWIEDFKEVSYGNFDDYIRGKFSKLVMMTFTKKAAGEMSIRLFERFREESQNSKVDNQLWLISNEALPFITVTTIDGFCKKLITLGYFPEISQNSEVIFFNQRKFQIKEIISEFFDSIKEFENDQNYEVVLRKKDSLISCFTEIFSDPGSRVSWEHFNPEDMNNEALDSCLEASFLLNNLDESLSHIKSLVIPETEKERSSFEKNVALFQSTSLPDIKNINQFKIYSNILRSFRTLQPERTQSKKDIFHERAHTGLVALKSWVSEWNDIVENYEKFLEIKILPWARLTKKIFDYINSRLDFSSGLTFGDMEYVVFKGLSKPEVRFKISNDFDYFIVDEFQDTSEIQFQIISGLIDNNFSKLFCVGDAKQAIYGFRGGELSVFNKCSKMIFKNLSLNQNYRSLKNIIEFNNSLFSIVFPLGKEFSGKDKFSVDHEDQFYPDGKEIDFNGDVKVFKSTIDFKSEDKFRPSTALVNKLESEMILCIIQESLDSFPDDNICILYQRLSPSIELIKKLMSLKVGFTAQFKIDPAEDPVLIIYLALLKRRFDTKLSSRDEFCTLIISSVLKKLDIATRLSNDLFERYDLNCIYFGPSISFKMFVSELNFSIENFDLNLKIIDELTDTFREDFDQIYLSLTDLNSEKISMEFRYGKSSDKVQIMTAHASKGLEFETVILGGILTNGKDQSESNLVGQIPGSFHWFKNITIKESYLTPQALLEKEIRKLKNFSESKRLFYVACTRAKKRLCWVDLHFEGVNFPFPRNSWIEGLRKWREIRSDVERFTEFEVNTKFNEIILNSKPREALPLYFYDQVGVYKKKGDSNSLGVVPDLSVTRLSTLLDCPRKFYFENILKISTQENLLFFGDFQEESFDHPSSTADRGSMVHSDISQMILRNLTIPRKYLGKKEQDSFQWLIDQMSPLRDNYEFRSEKALKFNFFNFMISGIPDLVLFSKSKEYNVQVWDFKTGSPSRQKLDHYWLQLKIYAYALYQLNLCGQEDEIELIISLFDIKENLKKIVRYQELKIELFDIWTKILHPWKINLDHCSQCSFGDICPR